MFSGPGSQKAQACGAMKLSSADWITYLARNLSPPLQGASFSRCHQHFLTNAFKMQRYEQRSEPRKKRKHPANSEVSWLEIQRIQAMGAL
eukprot:6392832-Karenia_brevis.AAC.1